MKILSFLQYCDEKRRNPELNPKISAYNYLKEYKDRDDIYITFTDIEKVGIKPLSTFNTPNGIYTYPLKEIWKEYNVDRARSLKVLPFASDRPWINILQAKHSKGFIKNLKSDYTSKDYDRDRNALLNMMVKNYDFESEAISAFQTIENMATSQAKIKSPAGSFWNLTRLIANVYQREFGLNSSSGSQGWNNILRRLGYSGFGDKSGIGLIHISEPIQAVFLHSQEFKVIDRIENKDWLHQEYSQMLKGLTGWDVRSSNIQKIDATTQGVFTIQCSNVTSKNDNVSKIQKNIKGAWPDTYEINFHLSNSTFTNLTYKFTGIANWHFNNCKFSNCKFESLKVRPKHYGGGATFENQNIFENCKFKSDLDIVAILSSSSTTMWFKRCDFESNVLCNNRFTGKVHLIDCSVKGDIEGVYYRPAKFKESLFIPQMTSFAELEKMAKKSKTFQDFERLYNEFRDKKSSDFEKMLFG